MYVERRGTGPEIYFALHGWGSDRTAFAPLAAHAPASASFYSGDLPGCGLSPHPREWSVASVADEVTMAVASAAGPRRVTLVGNCGGAIFCLLAAERLGEAITRIVMIDAFAYLPRYLRLFVAGNLGRRAYDATFANPLGRWVTNQSLRRRRAEGTDLTVSFAAVDHEAARRHLALFAQAGTAERFDGLTLPVDLVYGERSFSAVRNSVPIWQRVLPQARTWRLEGAGHQVLAEASEEISRIIFAPGPEGLGQEHRDQEARP